MRERRFFGIAPSQIYNYKFISWIGSMTGPSGTLVHEEDLYDITVGGGNYGRFTASASDPELYTKELEILSGKVLTVERKQIAEIKKRLTVAGCVEDKLEEKKK